MSGENVGFSSLFGLVHFAELKKRQDRIFLDFHQPNKPNVRSMGCDDRGSMALSWDKSVDFLVVGSGAAGMTAAIRAHNTYID